MDNPFVGAWAVLFDLDGTLVETHINFPQMRREMSELLERYGIDPSSLGTTDILTLVEFARRALESRGEIERAAELRRKAFARLEEIELEQCGAPNEIAGASELLSRLTDSGFRVGIVTRNCRTVARKLMRSNDLTCHALLTRDDVPLTKPNPEHLIKALNELGHPPPLDDVNERLHASRRSRVQSAAVMVGDHWMDVQGGAAAGMRTIGVLFRREPGFFDVAPPDLLVSKLADLLPLVPTS